MYDVVLRDTADVLKACVVKYVKKAIESHRFIVRATHAMKGWRESSREIKCKSTSNMSRKNASASLAMEYATIRSPLLMNSVESAF